MKKDENGVVRGCVGKFSGEGRNTHKHKYICIHRKTDWIP
jgi:hypothetical protein